MKGAAGRRDMGVQVAVKVTGSVGAASGRSVREECVDQSIEMWDDPFSQR